MPIPEQLKESLTERYRVERELGQCGMATVYLAEDLIARFSASGTACASPSAPCTFANVTQHGW